MLPANQHAGFGDLSFSSHSHSFSRFNSALFPISHPNPTKSQLQLHDLNGGEEEDEWAVYTSSRVASREKIGTGDLQVGPTHKPDDNVDEWGLFVASPTGVPANHTFSSGISSRKVENGGLQVGSTQKGEDWGYFFSSPVESQPKANGSNLASSNNNSIASEILTQRNNGGLQVDVTQNKGWGLFSSNTGSATEVTPTYQTSDQRDRIDNAGPSQRKTLLEEEEEDWGTFVSTPVASQANSNDTNGTRTSIFNEVPQRNLDRFNLHVMPNDYEEEWGEFVSSPVASGTKTGIGNSNSKSASVKWEKPKGPLPLSFFGGEEEELAQEETKVESLPNFRPFSVSHSDSFSGDSPSISSGGVKEIITNHSGAKENLELKNVPSPKINGNHCNLEATTTTSLDGSKNSTSNLEHISGKIEYGVSRWDPFANGENGVVQEAWEFKDASSDITSRLIASPLKQQDSTNSSASFSPLYGKAVSTSVIGHKADLLSLYTEPDHSEKKKTSPTLVSNGKMAVPETDQSYSSESTKKDSVLKFYRKLQEGSLLLVSHHIKGHKEASKVSLFSGQKAEERLDEEIQEAYIELKKLNVSEVVTLENTSRDSCINELLNCTEEEYLKIFEKEHQLSTKILLAVENLGPALDLLKHSLSTVNALERLSMEGINSYISTWYCLISVCSQELQNGASIWTESLSSNLADELISSGENYFIALGEIYRVVEILELTLKCFSSLLLLSNHNRLSEVDISLDMCAKAWSSGLSVALERISDGSAENAPKAKSLAESIKRIRELDIENDNFYKEKTVCKLCLLPLAFLPEMKSITWHGDKYIVKLANLWANKISSEPPSLPSFQKK